MISIWNEKIEQGIGKIRPVAYKSESDVRKRVDGQRASEELEEVMMKAKHLQPWHTCNDQCHVMRTNSLLCLQPTQSLKTLLPTASEVAKPTVYQSLYWDMVVLNIMCHEYLITPLPFPKFWITRPAAVTTLRQFPFSAISTTPPTQIPSSAHFQPPAGH